MDDIFSQATGRWKQIFQALGMPEQTWRENKPCVFCGGDNRASLLDSNGKASVYYCRQCKSHSPLEVIAHAKGWDKGKVVKEVKAILEIPETKSAPKEKKVYDPSKIARLRKGAISGHPAIGEYLKNRKIFSLPDQNVYYQPNARGWADEKRTVSHHGPAIIAAITDHNYKLMGFQKIFIENGYKAKIHAPKQVALLREMRGGFVPLYKATDTVGLAEGVETAIKCRGLFDIPVWSALNAGNLQDIILPSSIKNVWIFSDNDKNFVGQYAAITLAKRLYLQGYNVELRISEKKDFAEV